MARASSAKFVFHTLHNKETESKEGLRAPAGGKHFEGESVDNFRNNRWNSNLAIGCVPKVKVEDIRLPDWEPRMILP